MASVKSTIRKMVPEPVMSIYHFFIAYFAAVRYKFPSKKMVMIGITGTKGKTSTANFIWSCLTANSYKVGLIGTANIRIGQSEMLNQFHMTMPGPSSLQKIISQMADEGCKYCVMEVTSEGIKQFRHMGIIFDFAVLTNLTPEHLAAHGSFDKYREAKGKLFAGLKKGFVKTINGRKLSKTIILNNDCPEKDYFQQFDADAKITYGIKKKADFNAKDIKDTSSGVMFSVKDVPYKLNILGDFNIYNALPAIIIANELGVLKNRIQKGLYELSLIPGRMEKIVEGQNYTLIVDYAHEKESMSAVLNTAKNMSKDSKGRIIVLLGAEGGGRDKVKRPLMGKLAGKLADYVIVSNVDPYEDDPTEIVEDIAVACEREGKVRGKDLFIIEDRRKGINKALSLAKRDDIVLITGKGAEQSIVINGKRSDWDDRRVVREELRKILRKKIKT
ncbi:MAG: UDP-N-acetylmuramoyl-L-alanyl-D-glutamate--2,6-diaminopimelate ligase [bacterium]|nr:UDP-N-acetylmuramoyl-L-alanyl-D-glutamate--2,6-diaminopimelate ligase [bacterium]